LKLKDKHAKYIYDYVSMKEYMKMESFIIKNIFRGFAKREFFSYPGGR
jgi:hypothetical protein